MYACMYVRWELYVCMFACIIYIYMCVCAHVCVCMCVCACVCVCVIVSVCGAMTEENGDNLFVPIAAKWLASGTDDDDDEDDDDDDDELHSSKHDPGVEGLFH